MVITQRLTNILQSPILDFCYVIEVLGFPCMVVYKDIVPRSSCSMEVIYVIYLLAALLIFECNALPLYWNPVLVISVLLDIQLSL